jgi:elongation factor Ts
LRRRAIRFPRRTVQRSPRPDGRARSGAYQRKTMAEISAKQVMTLRAKTDLPMMDCKKALMEANGDEAAAIEILRKKMKGKLETKAERETAEGRIGVFIDGGTRGGMIELRCETVPVAKNEVFVTLCGRIAEVVARQDAAAPSPDAVLAMEYAPGKTVRVLMEEVFAKLGENMKLIRCRKVTGGYVASYVHHDGKTGVMAALDARPTRESAAKNLTFHIASQKPVAITRDGIPAEVIGKKRAEAREVALAEGKPEKIIDKIVEGKVNAFCAEQSLVEQEHIHPEEEKKKVKDALKAAGVNAVTDMVLMVVGG